MTKQLKAQLRVIENIYDLLALCSSYIFNELNTSSYEFGLFDEEKYYNVQDAIDAYCYDKDDIGAKKAYKKLSDFLEEYFDGEINIEKCYAVVRFIDESVPVEINSGMSGSNGVIKYESLNDQYKDQVRIFPIIKDTFVSRGEFKIKKENNSIKEFLRKKRDCACSILDAETSNYMIWDSEKINKYPVSIYRMDSKHSISKHFSNCEEITFGIVPLTNEPLGNILDVGYEGTLFYIKDMYDAAEENIKERYNHAYSRCKDQNIDFLVFPEMLLTDDIISSDIVKGNNISPRIIVNGSIWKDYKNKSVITCGNGMEIFDYFKKEPFELEIDGIKYKEYLKREENRKYSLLEIDGIGRIGIGICKDLISEEVKMFHKYIGTNILIVPAYSSSMDMKSAAEELAADYRCIVVMANSCSAFGEENEEGRRIGFVSLPAKCKTDRSKLTIEYQKDECIADCDNRCLGTKIKINFCKTEKNGDIESYSVEKQKF